MRMIPQDKQLNPNLGLYIGDLEDGVTEEQLYVEFRKFGQLQFHYAFLYYNSEEEAKKAQEQMNYKELLRQPIRVTPIKEMDREANVFFAGFPKLVTNKQIHEFFQKYGPVNSAKLSVDENKQSRGYGWVQFDTKENADNLITQSDKLIWDGQKIIVKKFLKKGEKERKDNRCNLYVKNFWGPLADEDVLDDDNRKNKEEEMYAQLKEWFSENGRNIISIFIKIDVERKAPYAFISFENNQQAKEAQEQFSKDQKIVGKQMYVGWAQVKKDRKQQRDNNINARYVYMEHLARHITEDDIKKTLKECGYADVVLVRLEKVQNSFTSIIRIGYLVFEQAADANRLIRTFKENEKLDLIKGLFEAQQDANKYFQHLFQQPRQQRNQRRNPQARISPNRRVQYPQLPMMGGNQMPFMHQMNPMQMQMGPGQRRGPQPGSGPMGYQQYRPQQQRYPPQQIPHQIQPPVAYEKRQDLLDLLNNLASFSAKSEADQRKQLGNMLLPRVKGKLGKNEGQIDQVVGILIDEGNFSIDEIIDMLKDEKNLLEQVESALGIIQQ
ncbi:hypothetical protein pb186bvf_001053 [Paramecium bursaria]